MNENWRRLKPTDVAKWINFGGVNGKWTYSPDQPVGMAALQTEGVAHLWNVLSRNPVALLADEVGMGKTFEALGVAALLWRRKPDAKILVIAPNRDICAHWQREFSAFTRDIYLKADGFVKAKNDGKPVPSFGVHYRLPELTEAIEQRSEHDAPAQFYITTIHALSGLVDSSNEPTDKTAAARRAARGLHRRIMAASDGAGFDLMIVDEAHYFRNRRGGSQRVAAAEEFFGKPEKPIAQRTLLLTATPSHTRLDDVASILGYFLHRSALEEKTVNELMRKYALRRFRRMEGLGISYTKHQYRREIATPCQFGDSPQDEMFFALYQKLLIKREVVNEEKRRALYGYLEGFESAGHAEGAQAETQGGAEELEDERSKDFRAAADTKLLQDMSSDFRRLFGTAPDHPKYDGIVKICAPQNLFEMSQERHLHEDKHLVFVRRIPSVRELTKRINERYDDLLAQHIADALGWDEETYRRWKGSNWSREAFNEIARSGDSRDPDSDDDPIDEAEGAGESADEHDYLRSRIADLFVTKKASDGRPPARPTDCSRFSLSLRKTTSIFAMLLEPASDYQTGAYPWYYHFIQGGKQRMDFAKAAQMLRMEAWSKFPRETLDNLRPHDADQRDYDEPLETIWSVVFHHLPESEKATLCRWATASPRIAENFANYLKAGFLFASPVIVELYGWHATFDKGLSGDEKHTNVQRRYRKFVDYVRQRIESSLLLKYFTSALTTFEQLCTKIIDHEVDAWDKGWRTLTTLSSPAWYASGESSHRQHLILGFNSPFYPNTLIATSVFQEGVNLHLQCRKVHHYGIAWTPGDNEQRVGRVDRLFGKVNSLLREHGPSEGALEINYPYLKDSFDEDQIGSFIERKYEVEEKMDRCEQGAFDKEIRLMRSGWEAYLRTPTQNETLSDPYPAAFTKD
ncbi:DEAD/DEAH box helicase family protein [Gluconobacter cerinus]|uniref:SNF2-related protein n=1 Tax=Gluconobacter cerinus TaxID=38307 RepID=UPI001B8B48F1|nr:SNF2-related protein [Gluconobacter cerinus]MBS1018725.1 DEAD/DEAH box helicase family protein [Gluconobacter cerinus]